MASEFEIVIKLDDGSVVQGFANIANKAQDAAGKVEIPFKNSFKGITSGLADVAGGFFLLRTAINAAIQAFQVPAELIKLNDQVVTVNKSFSILAEQAGVSGSSLKSGLEAAAGGVVDLEDILQTANKALVELGANSARLPEVLTIARQASKAFGVDTLSAFETLNQAIISGQTKQLKSIGIIVDSEAAYRDYALSIGKTVEQLTLAEKQQATLNLVIKEGAESFKNISASSPNLTESLKKLSVAWGDFTESILSSNSAIGRVLISTSNLFTSIFANIAKANEASGKLSTENAGAKVEVLTKSLEQLNYQLDIASKQSGPGGLEAQAIQQKIDLINVELSAASELQLQNQMAEASNVIAIAKTNAEREKTNQLILDSAINEDLWVGAMSDAFEEMAKELDDHQKQWKALGDSIKNSLVGGIANSMAAVGGALASGKNAGEEFANSWKRSLGALAVQVGQTFILMGLGMNGLAPLTGWSAGASIAAGMALTVLGGALQASGGGSTGNASNPSTAGGGGITTTDTATTEFTKPESLERQAPQTQVAVNINGDVLDSEESGLRIVDLLNKAFDKSGVQVRQGAFA